MVNAYYLGQLTAQPVKLQKMAANSNLKQLMLDRFIKEALTPDEYAQLSPDRLQMSSLESAEKSLPSQKIDWDPAAGASREPGLPSHDLAKGEMPSAGLTDPEHYSPLRDESHGGAGVKDKAQALLQKVKGGIVDTSASVGTALGGEAGKGFLKNPHTRTIAALLALLGAGAGGAYALSGGSGDKKER